MKKILLWSVLTMSVCDAAFAGATDVYVYAPDVSLKGVVSNVRLIDLSGDGVSLTDWNETKSPFGASEVGYLSFSSKSPSGVEAVATGAVSVAVHGFDILVSGLPATAQVSLYDVSGRRVANVTAHDSDSTVRLSVTGAGVYVLSVGCADSCETYKIVLK